MDKNIYFDLISVSTRCGDFCGKRIYQEEFFYDYNTGYSIHTKKACMEKWELSKLSEEANG